MSKPWIFGNKTNRHFGAQVAEGEKLTVTEALKMNGLDWDVEARNVRSDDDDAIPAPRHRQIVRVDKTKDESGEHTDYRTLGMVKRRYTTLSNLSAFKFFDTVTFDDAAVIRAVGQLDFGVHVWAIAERPHVIEIAPGDEIRDFLILRTSHDGSASVRVMFAPHRTINGTPMSVAFGRKHRTEVSIRHTKSMEVKLKTIHNLLVADTSYWDQWRAAFVGNEQGLYQASPNSPPKPALAKRVITSSEVDYVVKALFPAKKKKQEDGTTTEEVSTRAKHAREMIQARFEEQVNTAKERFQNAGVQTPNGPTALDLFIGVSDYVAMDRSTRNEGNRWVSGSFGTGADLRSKAFSIIAGM